MQILRWLGHIWIGALLLSCALLGVLLAVRFITPFTSSAPSLVESIPANASQDVLLRAQIQLRFDQAMNPRSVERALRIEPAIEVALAWDDTNTTLTISPTTTFQPQTNYQLALDQLATNKWFRALEQAAIVQFQTAPAPAVVSVLPANLAQQVPLDTAIHIQFSRPIVRPDQLQQPLQLPELQIEPAISGQATWLDQSSVLFRPDSLLEPGKRYTVRLMAQLADLGGGTLGRDVTWSFETRMPKPISLTPNLGARWLAGRTPLVVQLDMPLDLQQSDVQFSASPPIEGSLESSILPDATQVITFTPSVDWQFSTSYSAALTVGDPKYELALWSFTTTPPPALIGRFPGEGQILRSGQDVRLIFNAPIEAAALEQYLRFEPDAGPLKVVVSASETRISADFLPSTDYTLTIPSELTTQAGLPLGREYQIRFSTASAQSSVKIVTQANNFTMFVPDQPLSIPIQRVNVSALNLSLYQLDQASTIRALSFSQRDWADFQPERYGQPLLRTWTIALNDGLNDRIEGQLEIVLEEQATLPAGMYYLQLETPEGPRADVLLLGAHARLSMQQSGNTIVVWAVDALSAAPIADLPIRLYQDQALIQQGTSNADGIWQIERPQTSNNASFIALSSEPELSVVSSAWNDSRDMQSSDNYRIWFTSDRTSYQAGEEVGIAGVVRRVQGQELQLPLGRFPVQISLRSATNETLQTLSVNLDASGLISSTFRLPSTIPVGNYTLSASTGGISAQTNLVVSHNVNDVLQIEAQTPHQVYAGDRLQIPLSIYTSNGLPVANATISWTLMIEPQSYPSVANLLIGDPAAQLELERQVQQGQIQTNQQGQARLSWNEPISTTIPLRYALQVQVNEPQAASTSATYRWQALPADRWLGLAFEQHLIGAGENIQLSVQTLTGNLEPQASSLVNVQVYRQIPQESSENEPNAAISLREQRLLQRPLTTDSTGQAVYTFQVGLAGQYRVVASTTDAQGRTTQTVAYFWVSAANYTTWPDQTPALISDKTNYTIGDTAKILLTIPHRDGTALISRANRNGFVSEIQQVKAGQPISITLTADDLPNLRVALLLMQTSTSNEVLPAIYTSTRLTLQSQPSNLNIALSSDQSQYLPESTAIITVTTRDTSGQAVPARIILAAIQNAAFPFSDLPNTFGNLSPPNIQNAQAYIQTFSNPTSNTRANPLPPATQIGQTILWQTDLATNAQGELIITLPLPADSQQVTLRAWALHDLDQFAQADLQIEAPQAVSLSISSPHIFRQGDSLNLITTVSNTSALTQTAEVLWLGNGLTLEQANASQTLVLAPYQTAQIGWRLLAGTNSQANLHFRLQLSNQQPLSYQQELSLLPPITNSRLPSGVQQIHEYLDPISKQPVNPKELQAGQLVQVRVLLIATNEQTNFSYTDYLPSGMQLLSSSGLSFAKSQELDDRIELQADKLPSGIHQYQYMLRVMAPALLNP